MKEILCDAVFYIAVIFIICGIIMFKAVDCSFRKQKQRMEDPQKNFEDFQREMLEKGFRIRSHTIMGRLAPAFIIAMGIIMLIVTATEHLG